ncbi:hypothetical protein TTHERM_000812939 (macronuclear) [Tetrahymena thermophila SB210]|uniref:Uncharacterized protein n=1 Tax=Tetrahymena thermophila (strain SB210) TaxID=312017 RepID=W7XLG7_TETTS|nr:hypothetical protein TTHERM_000812939 [Tetrahymena thermophila SB210]EWS76259.1 hypothetical protein TTHERM_000812939 [Tetrahymena thermophila SB210]|eukprot:XP_012651218.1 hypothetical protein TTHERM_000812939 [Tetrahymena thermophila SB210]
MYIQYLREEDESNQLACQNDNNYYQIFTNNSNRMEIKKSNKQINLLNSVCLFVCQLFFQNQHQRQNRKRSSLFSKIKKNKVIIKNSQQN